MSIFFYEKLLVFVISNTPYLSKFWDYQFLLTLVNFSLARIS